MSDDVTQTSKLFQNAAPHVLKNRLAMAGHRAVSESGVTCLKPLASMMTEVVVDNDVQTTNYRGHLSGQGKADYEKYKDNAYFFGVCGRTAVGIKGLIQSKKAVSVFPSKVDYLELNADGSGKSVRDLAGDMIDEAASSYWFGLLTAVPTTPAGASIKDIEDNNILPHLVHYPFDSVINWHYEKINNKKKLALVVLKEMVSKLTGFEVEEVAQYRVLRLVDGVYTQELRDDENQIIEPEAVVICGGKPANEIPFDIIIPHSLTKGIYDDLIDANLQHYKVYADYGNKLHYSSFIIYTENNVDGYSNNMAIGNGVKWNGAEGTSFGVLQPDGNADSHKLALEDLEGRMVALGAEQLRPQTAGAESAEAKSLDKVAQNSTTASLAITISEAITRRVNFASRCLKGTEDTEYMLNTDYNPTGMTGQDLSAQVAAWQMGAFSHKTLYANLQKGELANPDQSYDEEVALIKEEDNNKDLLD